jgi:hypothetical protein
VLIFSLKSYFSIEIFSKQKKKKSPMLGCEFQGFFKEERGGVVGGRGGARGIGG